MNEDWSITYQGIISYSSPKAIDLNGDGIEDIVMGAGGEEWSSYMGNQNISKLPLIR